MDKIIQEIYNSNVIKKYIFIKNPYLSENRDGLQFTIEGDLWYDAGEAWIILYVKGEFWCKRWNWNGRKSSG